MRKILLSCLVAFPYIATSQVADPPPEVVVTLPVLKPAHGETYSEALFVPGILGRYPHVKASAFVHNTEPQMVVAGIYWEIYKFVPNPPPGESSWELFDSGSDTQHSVKIIPAGQTRKIWNDEELTNGLPIGKYYIEAVIAVGYITPGANVFGPDVPATIGPNHFEVVQ